MLTRRDFVRFLPVMMALSFMPKTVFGGIPDKAVPGHSGYNFKYIYDNKKLRDEYHLFLQNVYTLYPDPQAHNLVYELTSSLHSDDAIYTELQKRFPDIKPFLSIFTNSLPALAKQKEEMQKQTDELIHDMSAVNGYVEIGTTGRYYDGIKKCVKLEGKTYLLNTDGPTYNPGNIVERGQLISVGKFIRMGDYDPVVSAQIEPESIDLITNYIGFHHAPPDKRNAFIKSVAKILRPGGRLVLRDHDVSNQDMKFMAALAHDVFNAGLDISWEKNLAEIRNFTSIDQISETLGDYGLKADTKRLLQPGDPTANTLMVFTKA